MKKISEMKKCTKENRSFLAEYETKLKADEEAKKKAATVEYEKELENDSVEVKKEPAVKMSSFTSALKMLKNEDIVI